MKMSKGVAGKLHQVLLKKLKVEGQEYVFVGSARINLNSTRSARNLNFQLELGVILISHHSLSFFKMRLAVFTLKQMMATIAGFTPVTGSLIFHIGDALQIMSNGRYGSIEHLVVADPIRDRVSVPAFFNPSPEQIIGPFPQLLASGEKALYKRVLYKEYVTHFYKKPHNSKDTIEFALI